MSPSRPPDEAEEKLLDDIRKSGWHCIHVLGDDSHEPFSYTIGLFQTYGHPELMIYGLPRKVAHSVLNIAAEAAARGRPLNTSEPTDELLEGYPCVFVAVPRSEYPEHFGFARWYSRVTTFPSNKSSGHRRQVFFHGIPMLHLDSGLRSRSSGSLEEVCKPSMIRCHPHAGYLLSSRTWTGE